MVLRIPIQPPPGMHQEIVTTAWCLWVILLVVWLIPLPVNAAALTIRLVGLRNTHGFMRLSLYDRPETFPKGDGRLARLKVPIQSNPLTVHVPDLMPGSYAVTVHHDENGDGKLNRSLLGIPREGYGFSNDARAVFGPPSFASAAVQLAQEDTVITITVRYWEYDETSSPPASPRPSE
jgi:uncharacterized protein (DUF2141 family)